MPSTSKYSCVTCSPCSDSGRSPPREAGAPSADRRGQRSRKRPFCAFQSKCCAGPVHSVAGPPRRAQVLPDHHQPFGIRIGQRPEQQRVDDAEDCGVGADAQRQRDEGDHRERPCLQHHANGVPNILQKASVHDTSSNVLSHQFMCSIRARRHGSISVGVPSVDGARPPGWTERTACRRLKSRATRSFVCRLEHNRKVGLGARCVRRRTTLIPGLNIRGTSPEPCGGV